MKISVEEHKRLKSALDGLRDDRLPFWQHWRTIADYYLPRRYIWLLSDNERRNLTTRNANILDGTGTQSARVLSSGMMSGVTSPARPWARMSVVGEQNESIAARVWLDEVMRRIMFVFAISNFYNAMAVLYLDLAVFGTAAFTVYDDFDSIIHCTNHALGEYYLGHDSKHRVNVFAREFQYKIRQMVQEFGEDNVSDGVKQAWKKGGASHFKSRIIAHMIEPNEDGKFDKYLAKGFKYREIYWEKSGGDNGNVLAVRGYRDFPTIASRWEISGNDAYGDSPAMDALGDVIQLQHETKRKGQSLDFMVRPPLVADVQLQHRPTALIPGGMTFVAGTNTAGLKPAYEVRPPLQELTNDIRDVQARIREFFHNDLFQMISQLDTVRSAAEIDARREEKLVLLGPVLGRFNNEVLEPAIERTFNILARRNLLPEAPDDLQDRELEIQFISILHTAQAAVSAAPTERLMAFAGELSGSNPQVLHNIDFDETLRNYGRDIGAHASSFRSVEDRDAIRAQEAQQLAAEEALAAGQQVADGAKTLSETDVGGGANALQRLIG